MKNFIDEILIGLLTFVLLMAGLLVPFFAGARGWPFLFTYLGAAVALFVGVRLPMGDTNLIQSTVKGQESIPAYFIPLLHPALMYSVGWFLSVVVRVLSSE